MHEAPPSRLQDYEPTVDTPTAVRQVSQTGKDCGQGLPPVLALPMCLLVPYWLCQCADFFFCNPLFSARSGPWHAASAITTLEPAGWTPTDGTAAPSGSAANPCSRGRSSSTGTTAATSTATVSLPTPSASWPLAHPSPLPRPQGTAFTKAPAAAASGRAGRTTSTAGSAVTLLRVREAPSSHANANAGFFVPTLTKYPLCSLPDCPRHDKPRVPCPWFTRPAPGLVMTSPTTPTRGF